MYLEMYLVLFIYIYSFDCIQIYLLFNLEMTNEFEIY